MRDIKIGDRVRVVLGVCWGGVTGTVVALGPVCDESLAPMANRVKVELDRRPRSKLLFDWVHRAQLVPLPAREAGDA